MKRKIFFRIISLVLIAIGGLFLFSKPIKTHFVKKTTEQYALTNITKKEIMENKEKKGEFDFENVEEITSSAIVKSQFSDSKERLPIIASVAVPSVGINLPIFKGLSNEGLLYGAGTMFADQEMGVGNYALASHRSDVSELLFTPLENVSIGNKIYLTDLENVYTYEVTLKEEIDPDNTEVIDPVEDRKMVTLITCGDLYATTRIVVQGELIEKSEIESINKQAAKAFNLPQLTY